MNKLDDQPKSIKKAIRYIKQDASIEQLKEIEKLVNYAIQKRIHHFRLGETWEERKGI